MRHAVPAYVVLCFRSPPFEPYLSSSGLEASVLSLQLAELLLDATQQLDHLVDAPLGLVTISRNRNGRRVLRHVLSCLIRMAVDLRERGEIWVGQLCVTRHLTHAWPRASSAAGEAQRDCGRDQRGAGEGGRACTTRLPVMVLSVGRLRLLSVSVFST